MGKVVKGVTDAVGLTDHAGAEQSLGRANAISAENARYIKNIKTPDIIWQNLTTEDYNPELVDYQTISEDPQIRSMQMNALAKMGELSETGLSAEDALGFEKAEMLGQRMAKSGRDAALQNAEMRGVGGSGLEFAMREAANQEGAEAARMAALEQAATTARQRALYNQAYSDALGQQRSQDFGVNQANTNIMNEFNQANAQTKNQAQMYNQQNRQDAFKYNTEGQRGVQQQRFANEMQKAGALTGANNQVAQNYMADSAAKNAAGQGMMGALIGGGATLGAAAIKKDD